MSEERYAAPNRILLDMARLSKSMSAKVEEIRRDIDPCDDNRIDITSEGIAIIIEK